MKRTNPSWLTILIIWMVSALFYVICTGSTRPIWSVDMTEDNQFYHVRTSINPIREVMVVDIYGETWTTLDQVQDLTFLCYEDPIPDPNDDQPDMWGQGCGIPYPIHEVIIVHDDHTIVRFSTGEQLASPGGHNAHQGMIIYSTWVLDHEGDRVKSYTMKAPGSKDPQPLKAIGSGKLALELKRRIPRGVIVTMSASHFLAYETTGDLHKKEWDVIPDFGIWLDKVVQGIVENC